MQVLVSPMVLSFASPAVLGRVLSGAGLDMLAGSLAMSVWGGPRRRVAGGPLADRVFEPLLAAGGPLAAGLGPVLASSEVGAVS